MQSSVGNAVVIQMLRRAGHPGDQEEHQHGGDREHQQTELPVQRSTVPDVLRSPGRPLDYGTRIEMEARLGADFSDVRLHTDTTARASAAEVGARAYTSGNHVVIGDGGADKHTLAHELTHVIQQQKGPVAGTDNGSGLRVSDPADRFEREAEANASRVMRTRPRAGAPIQRAEGHGAPWTASAGRAPAVQRAAKLADLKGGGNAGAFGQAGAAPKGAGTVALVPAELSETLNLKNIAERYKSGFKEGTALADRFALVIGVNARTYGKEDTAKKQTLFTQKVDAFRAAWGDDQFCVAVIGFTWANDANNAQETSQRTIPYGEIRDKIMRSSEATDMITGLRAAGRKHVYFHTSDADTASFDTEAGPLFSAAAEDYLDTGELDVFSGGYTSPKDRRSADKDVLIWHASRVDLAVRKAMAQVEPALVYYPEPNTFVKVHEDYEELERGVSFGSGAQEGQHLMDSLRDNRFDGVTRDFDPRYAIATDMDRVGQKVGGHTRGDPVTDATIKQLFALAQTHARPQEWSKRVALAYGLTDAAVLRKLEQLVFAGLTMSDLPAPANLPATPIGGSRIDHASTRKPLKGIGTGVVDTAKASRDALVRAVARAIGELQDRNNQPPG